MITNTIFNNKINIETKTTTTATIKNELKYSFVLLGIAFNTVVLSKKEHYSGRCRCELEILWKCRTSVSGFNTSIFTENRTENMAQQPISKYAVLFYYCCRVVEIIKELVCNFLWLIPIYLNDSKFRVDFTELQFGLSKDFFVRRFCKSFNKTKKIQTCSNILRNVMDN